MVLNAHSHGAAVEEAVYESGWKGETCAVLQDLGAKKRLVSFQ